MKRLLQHIKQKLLRSLEIKNDKKISAVDTKDFETPEYLISLFENIKTLKEKNEIIAFKVVSIHPKGIKVKAKGLYCSINYNKFPIKFSKNEEWQIVYPYLRDKYFTAHIEKIAEHPKNTLIFLNGNQHQFEPNPLEKAQSYKGIILKIDKEKEGIILEFGHLFDWKSGSLKGFLPVKLSGCYTLLTSYCEGQEFETIFWGFNYKNEFILSNFWVDTKWFENNLNPLLSKKFTISVFENEDGKKAYKILDKYEVIIPVRSSIYGKHLEKAKLTIETLRPGGKIIGMVTRVNPIAGHIVMRLKEFVK